MYNIYLGLIRVTTPRQLNALSIQTYILAAITGVVFLLIAALIANAIKFEGGANPKDPGKRRLWFWALLFACFCIVFLYNLFFVSATIRPNLQGRFITTNIIASVISVFSYLLLGLVLSKMFSTGKLGSWFKFR